MKESDASLRELFATIRTKPVVMHNGWIDLVMLYHSFYDQLPKMLETFAADISYMFPRGVYDTKLVAECRDVDSKSVLNYLFRRAEREQDTARARGQDHISVVVEAHSRRVLPSRPVDKSINVSKLCPNFKKRAMCNNELDCQYSHDMDLLLDLHFQRVGGEYKQAASSSTAEPQPASFFMEPPRKKCRLQDAEGEIDLRDLDMGESGNPSPTMAHLKIVSAAESPVVENIAALTAHSAHTDALMTGYVFAHHLYRGWVSLDSSQPPPQVSVQAEPSTQEVNKNLAVDYLATAEDDSGNFANRVYLISKSYPLRLFKSAYTQYSDAVIREQTMKQKQNTNGFSNSL